MAGVREAIAEGRKITAADIYADHRIKMPPPACLEARVKGNADERKAQPIMSGCLDYFPDALLAVANLSKIGNDQHNPGQELHWARGKSKDHADTAVRHLIDRGLVDTDGVRHSTKAAWRALANLQEELERDLGLPLPRGASNQPKPLAT